MSEQGAPLNDDDAVLAAEYALGVLEPDERGRLGARLARDPAFAAEVQAWSERLAPLADEAAPMVPPPALWERIVYRLDAPREAPLGTPVPGIAANDNARQLRVWRRLAFGASGLAAASMAAVALLLVQPSGPAAQVAALATPEGATAVVVAFDEDSGALLVTPGPGLRPDGHSPHLWLVTPKGGVQLVGAIDPARAATHHLPRAMSRRAGDARGLALSLEPLGHKPIDKPGGPVVAEGEFAAL